MFEGGLPKLCGNCRDSPWQLSQTMNKASSNGRVPNFQPSFVSSAIGYQLSPSSLSNTKKSIAAIRVVRIFPIFPL